MRARMSGGVGGAGVSPAPTRLEDKGLILDPPYQAAKVLVSQPI